MVTGCLHTQGLKSLLRQRNISYLSITPNVTPVRHSRVSLSGIQPFSRNSLALSLASDNVKVHSVDKNKITIELNGEKLTLSLDKDNKFKLPNNWQKTITLAGRLPDRKAIEFAVEEVLTISSKINSLLTAELIYELVKVFSRLGAKEGIFVGNGLIWSIAADPKVQEIINQKEHISSEELSQLYEYLQEIIKGHALQQDRLTKISLDMGVKPVFKPRLCNRNREPRCWAGASRMCKSARFFRTKKVRA